MRSAQIANHIDAYREHATYDPSHLPNASITCHSNLVLTLPVVDLFSRGCLLAAHAKGMEATIACETCGLIQSLKELKPGTTAQCCRCRSIIRTRKINSLQRTAAFSLAAAILYVPANIYPILRMHYYGAYSESTIWDGCVNLFKDDQWLVAGIVFLASIVIPIFKLLGLFFLVIITKAKSTKWRRQRTWIYKSIEVIGPWAMLDVFLLSILVALVKLQEIATVMPGRGLVAFTAVVVCTILASASFDPKLIWNGADGDHE